ncbi:MAG: ABC transporter permease [Planctomycetota bacterium]|jgi:ribose transport system permease protein|nr:ABC transporter permease [Planctomycetota bacterium]
MSFMNLLDRIRRLPQLPVLVLFIVFLIWNAVMVKGFASPASLREFLNLMVPLGCLTIGVSMVLVTGGMDMSVGANVCLVNVIIITLMGRKYGFTFAQATCVGLLAALGVGLLNGIVIGYLRVNALLATFATQSVAQGCALWVMPLPGGRGSRALISWFKTGNLFGVLPNCALFLIIPLTVWYLLKWTPFGVWLYAVGRDEQKAFLSGGRTRLIKLCAYVFSALMAWAASVAFLGNIGSGDPNVGMSLTLSAIASTVIGGVSLSGGEGDALGALLGAFFFSLITYTVFGANLSAFHQDLATGLIILMGVVGMTLFRTFRKSRPKSREAAPGESHA